MYKIFIALGFLLWACTPRFVIGVFPKDPNAQPSTAPLIANPASEYCVSRENQLIIRQDTRGNQVGYCLFPDRTECEEWAYFEGRCQPGEHASAQ